MKQITNKEYEAYQKYLADKHSGKLLLPDTLRFICEANHYDAAKIGQHFLELLPTICAGTRSPIDQPETTVNKYWLQAATEDELHELHEMFCGFHDFRIERIDYSAAPDRIDLQLEYDTHDIRILLRFIGNVSMNFIPTDDFGADWLIGATLGIGAENRIIWAAHEDIPLTNLPSSVLWISGNSLQYALLDEDGQTKELPEELIHQTWHELNYKTGKYEDTEKVFHPRYLLE